MVESVKLDYLKLLPKEARYKGDHRKGEIEITADPPALEEIIRCRRHILESMGLPDTSAELGIVLEDEHVMVIRDPVKFPSKKMGTYLRIIERAALKDGVAGVVMLPVCDDRIYLREMFRHATRRQELEFPRGFRVPGTKLTENVEREIAEEIGLKIEKIIELGTIHSNTGLLSGTAEAFWVRLKPGKPVPRPEPEEALGKIVHLTPKRLIGKIRKGEIRDGYTLAALQLAQAHNLLKP